MVGLRVNMDRLGQAVASDRHVNPKRGGREITKLIQLSIRLLKYWIVAGISNALRDELRFLVQQRWKVSNHVTIADVGSPTPRRWCRESNRDAIAGFGAAGWLQGNHLKQYRYKRWNERKTPTAQLKVPAPSKIKTGIRLFPRDSLKNPAAAQAKPKNGTP